MMNRGFNPFHWILFVLLILIVSACGLGDGNKDDNPLTTPVPDLTSEGPDTNPVILSTADNEGYSEESNKTPQDEVELTPTVFPEPTEVFGTPSPFTWELFNPGDLWEDVEPVIYLQDACEYLQMRWDPEKSPPGTIVAPIMFHSVRKSGRPIEDSTSISEEYFHAVMAQAQDLGYETITSEQLIAFLTTNAKIPEKSMFMVLDDRRPGVTERFIPYLETNDWTLTLGWIIEDQREYLWAQMEALYESGRLDVQSHGYRHEYIVDETPEEIIREELFNPIPIIEDHFGKRPIIFIWPGGNFTTRSAEIAHEAGYHLAFTAYARGPIMFNWIPQDEEEKLVGDPLMTLPRFWSVTAWINLAETIEVGKEARAHALEMYPKEAAWYQANCGGKLPLPIENSPGATD
jgi:peptidoglycan/xylan/chitin deacetylase (PgdA/CDA1 family)